MSLRSSSLLLSSLSVSLLLIVLSCVPSSEQKRNYVAYDLSIHDRGGSTSRVVANTGDAFFIVVESPGPWQIDLPDGVDWVRVTPLQGEEGRHDLALSIDPNQGAQREVEIWVQSGGARTSFLVVQSQMTGYNPGGDGEDDDGQLHLGDEVILGDISLLEAPRLSGRSTAYYITHRVKQGQLVNYSVEYDVEYHHPIWVCYSADSYTSQRNTSRSDAWGWDPMVPARYEVSQRDFSGYSRGHMVASADRLFSREANVQTFYYTNMSPQRSRHNTGVWLQLEQLVQNWARDNKLRDHIYVVKGGTLREGERLGKTSGGITVPQYYWMAVLVERRGSYQGIAFWTEHMKPERVNHLRSLAIPIDVLEQRTGLDFFYNLPDDIEVSVERQQPSQHLTSWPGI